MTASHEQMQQQAWLDHCAWIAGLRAQLEQMQQQQQQAGQAPQAFGEARLSAAFGGLELDFDSDEPVYRSMSTGLDWQPSDELDFEEPVYRSLGGLGDEEAAPAPASMAAWAQSMPPLVQRQRGFNGSLF